MRKEKQYGNNKVYILANNKAAEDIVLQFMTDFMKNRDSENFIFIAYYIRKDIMLLHVKEIDKEIDFDTAIKMVKQDIENGELCADDMNLKKALKNPRVTTAGFLLDFIKTEE